MSTTPVQPLPSKKQLYKATALALAVAGTILVTIVLPAEFGIDPTGIGARLGLGVLAPEAAPPAPANPAPVPATPTSEQQTRNATEAANAASAFGASDQQNFAAEAFAPSAGAPRHESLSVTLAPGKGAEVKTLLKTGDGLVFHWTASAEVAVDMHGEQAGVKDAWTSYSVQAAQKEAAGTFVAPFEGSHGWYWQNRGDTPVTVEIEVTGFQEALYQP